MATIHPFFDAAEFDRRDGHSNRALFRFGRIIQNSSYCQTLAWLSETGAPVERFEAPSMLSIVGTKGAVRRYGWYRCWTCRNHLRYTIYRLTYSAIKDFERQEIADIYDRVR